jgi:outer membrane protein TolC
MVLAALIASASIARADVPATGVSFDDVLAASDRTPAKRAAELDVNASEALVEAAGAWPSPSVHVQTNRITARLVAGATLPLPIFGTVGSARRLARANANVTRAEAVVSTRDLQYRAAAAWVALARADAQVEAATTASTQAAELESIAKGRLAAGVGAEVDVTIAQAARARATLGTEVARRAQRRAAAELAGILAWDPSRPIVASGPLPMPAGALPSLTSLRDELARHPAHVAGAGRLQAAEASVADTRVLRRPGLAIETQVSVDDPTTPGTDVLVGVSLDLPVFARIGARVRAEQARAAAARTRLAETDARLDAAIVGAYERWQAAIETLGSLERDILPAQERASTLSAQAYREGARDLATALQASRDLAAVRAEVAAARTEAADAWLDVQNASGADLGRHNAR